MSWIGDFEYWIFKFKTTQSFCITHEPDIEWGLAIDDVRAVFRASNQLEF